MGALSLHVAANANFASILQSVRFGGAEANAFRIVKLRAWPAQHAAVPVPHSGKLRSVRSLFQAGFDAWRDASQPQNPAIRPRLGPGERAAAEKLSPCAPLSSP